FRPTIQSLTVARPTDTASTATISGKGTYWNGKIGTKANTITYTITDDASVSATTPTLSGTAWTISQGVSNVPYQSSFHFTVTIKDAFGQSETRQIALPQTVPVLWLGKKTMKYNGVEIVESILDKVYPIGSIYITVNNVNPGTLFGGTWQAFGAGRTLIGAGTGKDANSKQMAFTAGATGGEYSHQLTVNELPSHTHQFIYRGGNYQDVNAPYKDNKPMTQGSNSYGKNTLATGGNRPHNNIMPYIVTYMWRRIS
ncbi:MAG: phage baseplate protein, partial [Eubacterium sp.]